MKKIIFIILVLLCLIISMSTVMASDASTFELPDLNLKIDVPADWITFTRDIKESDPNLELLGVTADLMKSDFEDKSIYLDSICLDPTNEIVVTMVSDQGSKDAYDLTRVSDQDFQSTANSVKNEMQKLAGDSINYNDSSTYTHEQAKFVVFRFTTQGDMETYSQQYTTIINGQTINITMHSFTGELTADQEELLKNTVDSVVFSKITAKPFDVSQAIISGVSAAVIAGVVVLVLNFSKKRKYKTPTDLQ